MNIVEDISIVVRDEEVFNLLGYTKERGPTARFLDTYKEMKNEAMAVIKPQALFELFNIKTLPPRDIFNGAREVAFSVLTIGQGLEQKVSKLGSQGKLERSVILDAIGSNAAEEVANCVNSKINEMALERKYSYSNRFSPGYCTWDLHDQSLIFERIQTDRINVSLTKSYMMIPRKSISFGVNIGLKEELDMNLGIRTCESCEKLKCKFKKKNQRRKRG